MRNLIIKKTESRLDTMVFFMACHLLIIMIHCHISTFYNEFAALT